MRDHIRESNYAETMENKVMPYLNDRRREGTVITPALCSLYYVFYTADRPRGTVTVLHGFTENAEKYRELIYVFLQDGWNVCLPELRGHGRSRREVEDLTLTHIERFDDYVDDFRYIVHELLGHAGAPHMLFAHSMGGAIAVRYLEECVHPFFRVVLSSPMIAPARGNTPLWLAKTAARLAVKAGKGKERPLTAAPYPGKESFADSCAGSEERFLYYDRIKSSTPFLQNYSPTYRWMSEMLNITRILLRPGAPERITVPVQVYLPENDGMVLRKPQEQLISRLPYGTAVTVPGARHEIYRSSDAVLFPYLDSVLDYFDSSF